MLLSIITSPKSQVRPSSDFNPFYMLKGWTQLIIIIIHKQIHTARIPTSKGINSKNIIRN